MPDAFIFSNVDFEYELAGDDDARANAAMRRQLERWRHVLRLMPGFDEARVARESISDGRICLWGVTETTRALAPEDQPLPEVNVVRRVNDKRFSHRLESELEMALPGARTVEDVEELREAARTVSGKWVAKHPFGVSGRERILGEAGEVDARSLGWAEGVFAKGWTLLFEPWVSDRVDFSLQFEISTSAETAYIGSCALVTDGGGHFRGHRVDDVDVPPAIVEGARRIVDRVRDEGYFGPVGIDALQGVLDGESVLRPVVEINARMTFGRLALELRRFVPQGWSYLWWHPSARRRGEIEGATDDVRDAHEPGLYRLPDFADPEKRTGTVVAIAPPGEELPLSWA